MAAVPHNSCIILLTKWLHFLVRQRGPTSPSISTNLTDQSQLESILEITLRVKTSMAFKNSPPDGWTKKSKVL